MRICGAYKTIRLRRRCRRSRIVDDYMGSLAANLCRDLPKTGRPEFPLYPSRYLLVEVGLTANRGAELAPRLAVVSLAAQANALAHICFGRADTPEGCSFRSAG